MNIRKIRALRHIRRFNFHNCNKYQNVAEHSFFVGILAYYIMLGWRPEKAALAMAVALHHDIAEAVTGDIPYLVRQRLEMKEIDQEAMEELDVSRFAADTDIVEVIDFADAFELKLYLEEERRSGNNSLYEIECETYHRLFKYKVPNAVDWVKMLDPMPASNFKGLLHE